MYPVIAHIYGPFSIHSYGLAIAAGLALFSYFFLTDQRRASLISTDDYWTLLAISIGAALIGGKALYLMTYPEAVASVADLTTFINGGFSVLGSTVLVIITLFIYTYVKAIPFLAFIDLAALYAPLLQACGRIGCLLGGCCFGAPTDCWCALRLPDQSAIYTWRHPTQLYSSLLLFLIFLCGYFLVQKKVRRPGALASFYLVSVGSERLINEFFRAEQPAYNPWWCTLITINQWVALGLIFFGLFLYLPGHQKVAHEPL